MDNLTVTALQLFDENDPENRPALQVIVDDREQDKWEITPPLRISKPAQSQQKRPLLKR